MESKTLWEAYQKHGDPEAREQLLARHLRLVHHVAGKIMRKVRDDVDFDDLVSAGTIGLMKAIDTFDPDRGLAFSTFAAPRIRGAILDDLRRWDHASRSIRTKQRKMARAQKQLMGTLDRKPSDQETARELGIDVETLWRWQAQAQDAVQVSLDRPLEEGDGRSLTPADVLPSSDEGIDDHVNRKQEIELLREEIMKLKERDRLVLTLYYYEGLKLREIAEVLDLTESRISQIRSKVLKTLRSKLAMLRE